MNLFYMKVILKKSSERGYNMGSGKSGNYSNTVGNLKPSYLMEELKKAEKFIEEDIVMITKQ